MIIILNAMRLNVKYIYDYFCNCAYPRQQNMFGPELGQSRKNPGPIMAARIAPLSNSLMAQCRTGSNGPESHVDAGPA